MSTVTFNSQMRHYAKYYDLNHRLPALRKRALELRNAGRKQYLEKGLEFIRAFTGKWIARP